MPSNVETVINLDRKRMQAMGANDVVALKELLADDLVYTHASARVDSKENLIGNMVSGAVVYASVEAYEVNAMALGDVVVLTGAALVKGVSKSVVRDLAVRFTNVYAKRDNRWRMVAWQSTPIPKS